jgi:hypothetical protein
MGRRANQFSAVAPPYVGGGDISFTGSVIELQPEKLNVLYSLLGANGDIDPLVTYTMTYSRIFVTPRWSLL